MQGIYRIAHLIQHSVLGGVGDLANVRPDAEVAAFVSDDQPHDVVALQLLQRPVAHLQDAPVYGIAPGMKLQAEYAVAEVEQARRIVSGEFTVLLTKTVERDVHRVFPNRLVLLGYRAVDELPAVFFLVETLVS